MNDFGGLLSGDLGFKPQGKSAPIAPRRSNPNPNSPFNFDIGPNDNKISSSRPKSAFIDDHDTLFRKEFSNLGNVDDIFGMGSKSMRDSTSNLDSMFSGSGESGPKFSSLPVYDKPVYDDDGFDSKPAVNSSSSAPFDNMFSSTSSTRKKNVGFDDLLGALGRKDTENKGSVGSGTGHGDARIPRFDDLLPGFGRSAAQSDRNSSNSGQAPKSAADSTNKTSSVMDDPFVVLESTSPPTTSFSELYDDPLEQLSNLSRSGSRKVDSSVTGGVFNDIDPLDGLGKSMPAFSKERDDRLKNGSPGRAPPRASARQSSARGESSERFVRSPDNGLEKKVPVNDYHEPPEGAFEKPSVSADSHRTVPNASSSAYVNANFKESKTWGDMSARSEEKMESSDEVWLTVSEIPLFTEPTSAPPPSRPAPPRPAQYSRAESFTTVDAKKKVDEYSSFPSFQSPRTAVAGPWTSMDQLEEFVVGINQSNVIGGSDVLSADDGNTNSVAAASAAAMKEAVDKAQAKFRHAREVRERENARTPRNRDFSPVEKEERSMQDAQEREFKERQVRERQQREREQEERRRREEEERRRIEKERERAREIEREREAKERERRRIERERELARQAVERATREARERAAVEARSRAEKAAVEKAQAEARERAERAAVQRAQAEARERAAAEAKERAEKVAAERAKAEAKEKAARERAAAAARANQHKNENDLESFFSAGSRASSAPRASSTDPFDAMFQSKPAPETVRASVNSSSSMRKASSSANIVDDLSSIFGAPASSGEFQEVEGETEERRRARLERHQRTQERAAKALAEKNARDLEVQREQAERHRIAETLDVEIKRWAAGKEGNLRALLSTLQYVLWPECGWQPVSLTDLIAAASVKKVYRKATLCIHPDKVQQKGATLQRKYIAEKVFDLLKEAWNKFNSEELF